MSFKSILRITDCITTIDLLSIVNGFLLNEWKPQVAPYKGDGVWQSSPLVDGKRLSSRNFDNTIETFNIVISGADQDAISDYLQSLTTMLEKAVSYWTTSWQKQPVWLEARGATETNPRYAVIKSYKIDGMNNPFAQPAFGDCKSTFKEFTLVIERDHWIDQYPGTAVCLDLNTLQSYMRSAKTTGAYACANSADDVLHSPELGTNIASTSGIIGCTTPNAYEYEVGIRFPNVTIPKGATIGRVYVSVQEKTSYDPYFLNIGIWGELVNNAALFTNSNSEFNARRANRTAAYSEFLSEAGDWSTPTATHNIELSSSIIQELIDQDGWVSGNALVIFMTTASSGDLINYRSFETVDSGTPPVLNVEYYSTPSEANMGHEDTCTGNLYIANKGITAQLTHIFYNDSGTGYSGNLIGTARPWTLLPAVPANGDEILFGISNDVDAFGPFDNLVLDISVASAGLELTYYYSQGGGNWGECDPTLSDKSIHLSDLGERIIIFPQESDFDTDTVNGITGYWIKAVVTTTGATTPPQQETREIYTCVMPFVDVDGDDIVGEIPALARVRVSGVPNIIDYTTNVVVASRSKSRGLNFNPYINFANIQNPPGVSMETPGNVIEDLTSPSGWCIEKSSSSESDTWYRTQAGAIMDGTISKEYQGSFRVYARYKITAGDDGDFDIRLRVSSAAYGPYSYSPVVSTKFVLLQPYMRLADFGIFELGSASAGFDDQMSNFYFTIEYRHNVATASTIRFYDLILMPTDEWFGTFQNASFSGSIVMLQDGKTLDIDSIGNPRTSRAILRNINQGEPLSEPYIAEWIKMTRGGPFLQIKADQRLWFLGYWNNSEDQNYIFPNQKYKVRIYTVNRYLTMRGAR